MYQYIGNLFEILYHQVCCLHTSNKPSYQNTGTILLYPFSLTLQDKMTMSTHWEKRPSFYNNIVYNCKAAINKDYQMIFYYLTFSHVHLMLHIYSSYPAS